MINILNKKFIKSRFKFLVYLLILYHKVKIVYNMKELQKNIFSFDYIFFRYSNAHLCHFFKAKRPSI